MERLTPAAASAGRWQIGTVRTIVRETPRVKSFRIALPEWSAHLPGQHYDVRLTAPDGYFAQRSYSVASSPLDVGTVELTIDRLEDGEVSPYFHDIVVVGDRIELRGPLASSFVWRGESPVLLVGGGSGVVPLMAMLRHRRRAWRDATLRLIYSVRHPEDVIYARELAAGDETLLTYTSSAPAGWRGHVGRIDAELVARAGIDPRDGAAFVCGTEPFVETATELLLDAGFAATRIRTERFGPTGIGS